MSNCGLHCLKINHITVAIGGSILLPDAGHGGRRRKPEGRLAGRDAEERRRPAQRGLTSLRAVCGVYERMNRSYEQLRAALPENQPYHRRNRWIDLAA